MVKSVERTPRKKEPRKISAARQQEIDHRVDFHYHRQGYD